MTARQWVIRRYLSPGGGGQTARERKLRLHPSHLRFGLAVLFLALAFLGRSFELSPTSAVHAAPLAELVLYDDAFQNGYSTSSWESPQPDPSYAANVFEGSFALRKNLFCGRFSLVQDGLKWLAQDRAEGALRIGCVHSDRWLQLDRPKHVEKRYSLRILRDRHSPGRSRLRGDEPRPVQGSENAPNH